MNEQETQQKSPSGNPIWFKAKRYGYGWYPATWQGWLVLLVYLVVVIGSALLVGVFHPTLNQTGLILFLGIDLVITISLILVCTRYGEKASWRWGNKNEDQQK